MNSDPFLKWWTSIDTANYSHPKDLASAAWDAAAEYFTGVLNEEECPNCDGVGLYGSAECDECNGTGKVSKS